MTDLRVIVEINELDNKMVLTEKYASDLITLNVEPEGQNLFYTSTPKFSLTDGEPAGANWFWVRSETVEQYWSMADKTFLSPSDTKLLLFDGCFKILTNTVESKSECSPDGKRLLVEIAPTVTCTG